MRHLGKTGDTRPGGQSRKVTNGLRLYLSDVGSIPTRSTIPGRPCPQMGMRKKWRKKNMISPINVVIEEAIVQTSGGEKTFVNVIIERELANGRVHKLKVDPREIRSICEGLLHCEAQALEMQTAAMKAAAAKKHRAPLTAKLGDSLGLK